MVSFHSFKGGVGRTTALMTYKMARLHPADAQGAVKVLVVDADLEAPGVTFWLDENRPQVSFVQFLEAMHYPPVSEEASLNFFAEQLKKTSLNVDGSQRELFVLPCGTGFGRNSGYAGTTQPFGAQSRQPLGTDRPFARLRC